MFLTASLGFFDVVFTPQADIIVFKFCISLFFQKVTLVYPIAYMRFSFLNT